MVIKNHLSSFMNAQYTEIRQFLEECPVPSNDNQPLNPGGQKQYVIIISHCHYDHIYGLPAFYEQGHASAPPIITSSWIGKHFVSHDIYTHSLARFRNLPRIEYKPTHFVADDTDLIVKAGKLTSDLLSTPGDADTTNLGITIFNTPGHVPDEIAWYDQAERHLYVGDSIYETGDAHGIPGIYPGPIIFPKEGNWVTYVESMKRLLSFVQATNLNGGADGEARVMLGAAHNTISVDAEEAIKDVLDFFTRVAKGEVPITRRETTRGEEYCRWDDGGRFGVGAPLRLCEEYRKHSAYSAFGSGD
ncbi:hypothetical protein KVT40_002212 [Elsinoe batatas]|uniref:Metallo-beta-lactamase domain-containing protein n=1 Tax=Elsinoe batatas TaxID=2601811 RepID=A0A8K0LE83_9PEZI|nr:hypothetical protein KVT40_002212 [Elsinoe batatas]